MDFHHTSVLLEETIENLLIRPGGIYVDGTLGGGGHSAEILSHLGPAGMLIGIDRDEAAIQAAGERLFPCYGSRARIVRGNFSEMPDILKVAGIGKVDGIVLDLGVSSYQLDTAERGFSYMSDAPLDMRMDQRESRTAADLVNDASEGELFRIIRDYGEERFAANIARNIVKARSRKRIETTGELSSIIKASIPMKNQKTGGHPAKRTFQALRIELNGELSALEDSLDAMIGLLADGGRICVITFHSLEDRIVKTAFRRNENPCTCPPGFPVCICGKKSRGRVISRKPILPSPREMEENPRSRSAKLRVFEGHSEADWQVKEGSISSEKGC
ncbi:MAG: 16S rRNA (cytosine(1402)-N(4))-methyltransferase RsmH [Lachnospiraceae bacterium]|nr:16S rRNA (cytosine(1402)-N(4))-methyltransferase RsmH [Lachnospiraceae bacterium]